MNAGIDFELLMVFGGICFGCFRVRRVLEDDGGLLIIWTEG